MAERAGRLVVVCGLPGTGKTTVAQRVAEEHGAVRFSADDWMDALGIDLWDQERRAALEALQWDVARSLLAQGAAVVVEWGTWSLAERDELRTAARAVGAAVHLVFLDAPVDELWRRIRERGREDPPITREDLERWSQVIERPTAEELARFDPLG
jgi:predicted kinase